MPASVHTPSRKLNMSPVIVTCVTGELPSHLVPLNHEWEHIKGLQLADPEFGKPGKMDILLGVETFVDIMRHGRRRGRRRSPTAIKTTFGWVLAGNTNTEGSTQLPHTMCPFSQETTCYTNFGRWKSVANSTLTSEERTVLNHFDAHHSRNS